MEDFHTVLRSIKDNINFRWGLIGRANPLPWDTNFEPGSDREMNHLKKVARQFKVMERYAKDVFPDMTFDQVLNEVYVRYHLD